MIIPFLYDGPKSAAVTLLLAHGAGAPMDSAWMNGFAEGVGKAGVRVARFEFAYMAARRQGQRKPPPKAETLMDEFRAAIEALMAKTPLLIGGKSMGGRVASMIADEAGVAGLVCLGYPFHPPGQTEKLRTGHLEALKTKTLICQGTRDPFGTRQEVQGYRLSKRIALFWLEDGDHDFRPRLKVSGLTLADNMALAIAKTAAFAGKSAAV
ncbi:MAG: alpha/beta family hydrolase [Devosia sp.]